MKHRARSASESFHFPSCNILPHWNSVHWCLQAPAAAEWRYPPGMKTANWSKLLKWMRMLESESDKTNKSSPDIRSVPGCRGVELEGTGDSGAIYLHCLTFTLSIALQKVFLLHGHKEETSLKFLEATRLTRYAPVPVCLIVASLKLTIGPKNVRAWDKDRQIDVYLPRDYGEQRRGN